MHGEDLSELQISSQLPMQPAHCPLRKPFMGECNKENSFKVLDFFWENGGNFIDT
jgi:hypothetical protein